MTDTEATLRRVATFIDLSWDAGMLDYHRTAANRMQEKARESDPPELAIPVTASERVGIHALTSKPPIADRIGRGPRDSARRR